MRKTVLFSIALFAASSIAFGATTVQPPQRISTGIGTWTMSSTVSSDEPAVAELWSTVFKIGPDGERIRSTLSMPNGGTATVSAKCYSTRATIGWWTVVKTSSGTVRSSTTWVKCG